MGTALKKTAKSLFAKDVLLSLFFIVVLIATINLYLPGIDGPFLLDDIYNLSALAYVSDMGGLKGIWYYLGSNTSGVFGRPVALLSFLLNDAAWPTTSASFKLTNILLHTICSISVFWLIFLLFRQLRLSSTHALIIAGFTAVIWSVHPINVSTVLYVVQRMTILMTMFGLWALICFVYAFSVKDQPIKVHVLMILGFGGGTLLSVLSKENGALIPLYALVIGWLIFDNGRNSLPVCKRYLQLLLIVPLLIVIYFYMKWPSLVGGYEGRDFTLVERLFTQCRLLVDYLSWILLPNQVGATLFFDDYVISKGLLNPISTLYSIITIFLLLSAAIFFAFNKRLSIVSLGIAWFFAGHLIESTFIPLEIAFEHRNYMPSIGIILVIVYCAWVLLQRINFLPTRYALGSLIVGMIFLSSLLTSQHVHSWSDWPQLIFTWAFEQPNSKRAQWEFAEVVAAHGQPDKAIEILEELSRKYPDDLTTYMSIDVISCKYFGAANDRDWQAELKDFNIDMGALLGTVERYVNQAKWNNCNEVNFKKTQSLLTKIKQHTKVSRNPRMRARILYIQGNYEAHLGNYEGSMTLMDQAAELQKTIDFPLRQAVISREFGEHEAALEYIRQGYKRDSSRNWRYPSRRDELAKLEATILKSVSAKNG